MQPNDPDLILNETNYIENFCSGIEQENIFGVQYHPEKSHDSGRMLLKNFISL
jgi:glutamine amidotransferase